MESLKSIKKESAVTHGRSRRPEIATYFIVVTRRPSLNPQNRCRRITDWPRTNLGEKSGLGVRWHRQILLARMLDWVFHGLGRDWRSHHWGASPALIFSATVR